MPEPLKEMYSEKFIRDFAGRLRSRLPSFQEETLVGLVLGPGWQTLELKARMPGIHRMSLIVNGHEAVSAEAVLLP